MSELRRTLGPSSAVAITVGGVIGSGIFLKPWEVAQYLPNPFWILLCWTVLGIICLFGGFAYAELGTMFPEAGGQYAFLREGWGEFVAFLYGWCLLLVINTGSIAALAVAFSTSLSTVVAMSPWIQIGVSATMVLLLAVPNHFGVHWGALLQNVSTVAKLTALTGIVLTGFFATRVGQGRVGVVSEGAQVPDLVTGLVAAAVAIFWAYEGWHQLAFSAAELKRPERDLPRGLIYGVLVLTLTYCAVNAVYIHLVPLEEMRVLSRNVAVPKITIERIFGPAAGNWLALLICLSVFGAANINLLSTPRAFYAMAKDGLAFRVLNVVHPVYRTPTAAIWMQAIWAIVLIIVLKTFRDITEYVVFAALIFYGLTVAVVYLLRVRLPDHPRPFRCIGYPWTPGLFMAVVAFVDIYTLTNPEKRLNALMGLIILTAGVPVYLWLRKDQ
jgi:basic amino acid/polyamine antiporter, APA family